MPTPLTKLKPGDALTGFPAEIYNGAIDCIEDLRSRRPGFTSNQIATTGANVIVDVLNGGDTDLNRFDVVTLHQPLMTPDNNLQQFFNRPTFSVATPDADMTEIVYGAPFGILQAPIRKQAIGPALIAGISPVRVDRETEGHAFADIQPGSNNLRAIPWGCANLIWSELSPTAPDGAYWNYVLLAGFARKPCYGVTQDAIANGQSGIVTVWNGGTELPNDELHVITLFGNVGSDVRVYIFPAGPEWLILQAPC